MPKIMRFEKSVPEILKLRAEADPDGIILEDVAGGSLTNKAFHHDATGIAYGLASLGLRRGDCVVTLLDPCLSAHTIWIGTCWLGVYEVPVNPEFKGNGLVYGISDSRARVLITSNDLLEKIASVRERLEHIQHVLTIDDQIPTGIPFPVQTLSSVVGSAQPVPLVTPTVSDPYAVIYTSGTTGPSKGVVVPWGNLQFAPQQMFPDDNPNTYDEVIYYSPWPTFHASGRCGLAVAALWGGRMVIRKRLSISSFWDDIRRFGCTHTQTMGLADYLLAQAEAPDDTSNPLRRVIMNPVIARFREFEERFGVKVSTGWGMTEIGLPLSSGSLPNAKTCGQLSPLFEARIVDTEYRDVAEGEVGQLLVRPKKTCILMREYLGKPEATAKSWMDGWFCTGDALRRDENGYYYFVDRVADYLRVRGNNVSSVELEGEVRAHPCVMDCAAIAVSGMDRETETDTEARNGTVVTGTEDEIKIVVVLREGNNLTERELIDFLIPRLPRFMVPRFIEFATEVPRTPTGKIQKKLLRERATSAQVWDRIKANVELPR